MLQIIIVITALILDQLSKYLVSQAPYNLSIIDNVFQLRYARNYGAAFGIMTDLQVLIIIITCIVSAIIAVMLVRERRAGLILRVSLSLMLGGALGNLIDRIVLGYVVDFFDFYIIRFAIFNVADCCVVVGTILFCIYILFLAERDKHRLSFLKERPEDT